MNDEDTLLYAIINYNNSTRVGEPKPVEVAHRIYTDPDDISTMTTKLIKANDDNIIRPGKEPFHLVEIE